MIYTVSESMTYIRRKGIIDTPNCLCGKQEDAYNFFFICKNYSTARYVMFDKLFALLGLFFIDTNTVSSLGSGTKIMM